MYPSSIIVKEKQDMFEERKIENYKKQIKILSEENKSLKEEIKMLNQRIDTLKGTVEEADKYIDIMKQERMVLAQARDKYDLGYKELMKIKEQYTAKVDELIDEFKTDNK